MRKKKMSLTNLLSMLLSSKKFVRDSPYCSKIYLLLQNTICTKISIELRMYIYITIALCNKSAKEIRK